MLEFCRAFRKTWEWIFSSQSQMYHKETSQSERVHDRLLHHKHIHILLVINPKSQITPIIFLCLLSVCSSVVQWHQASYPTWKHNSKVHSYLYLHTLFKLFASINWTSFLPNSGNIWMHKWSLSSSFGGSFSIIYPCSVHSRCPSRGSTLSMSSLIKHRPKITQAADY